MIRLAMDILANSIEIETEIWRTNTDKFIKCYMIFDTGAAMTTIDTDIAIRCGYDLKNAKEVLVNGIGRSNIQAKQIIIPSFKLDNIELGSIAADVVDFPENSNTRAVLGVNVIKEFRVIMDFQDKSIKDGIIYLEPTFDINDIKSTNTFNPFESRFSIWNIDGQLPVENYMNIE